MEQDHQRSIQEIKEFIDELAVPAQCFCGFDERFSHCKYQITFKGGVVEIYIGNQVWHECTAGKVKELKKNIPLLKSMIIQYFRNLCNADN